MKVHTRVSSPLTRLENRFQASPNPPKPEAPVDTADIGEPKEKGPFLNTSTLLRAAKWGAIGAAAGTLPFLIGAKAGGVASMFAAGKVVDALADNREDVATQLAWLGVGTAVALAAGVGGTFIGMVNDGFTVNQMILGAASLGAFTTGLSLAGDAIEYARS